LVIRETEAEVARLKRDEGAGEVIREGGSGGAAERGEMRGAESEE